MKKDPRLEELRKRIPKTTKEQVDDTFDAIDQAYRLGCEDTKQKLLHQKCDSCGRDKCITAECFYCD